MRIRSLGRVQSQFFLGHGAEEFDLERSFTEMLSTGVALLEK